MSPWAWLAALAAGCLVLASSTALYAVNPGLRLDLPWWSAVVAPALVYALVLPLCVARIRVGGWLIGFGLLAALHVGLGMATAWLYAQVSLVSIRETLAPAFWSFAPALVLEMVGALLMTLPFLGVLAPRAPAPRERAERIMAEASARGEKFDLSALAGTARQTWARPAPPKAPVAPPPAPAILSSGPPPVTAIAPEVEEPPLPAPVEREHAVHAAALAGTNGSSSEKVEDMTEVAPPGSFRDAVLELLGRPVVEAKAKIEDMVEPPVTIVRDEPLSARAAVSPAPVKPVESVPSSVTPVESVPSPVPETPTPAASPTVVRIPFDRVVGQLPPGAFRVPLPQLGARLREPETLLVAHALIVPQLGEGVVQVAWEDVAEQFPAAVLAVPPTEVKERIVNGRLLLPLDEIVRQLPSNVFGSSLGRRPVEVPGIESFPAPFKPMGLSAPTPSPVPEPARHVEPATTDVPSVAQVAADLDGVTLAAPSEAAVTSMVEPALPEPSPGAAAPHASLLDEEADRTQSEALEPPAPLPAHVVEPVHERVVESPAIPAPELPAQGEQVRIPFERVLAQLPPGAFRVPLDQVGARLAEPGALLVPQALVVSQLAEGAVYAPWEAVAAQFSAAMLAIDPAEVKKRLENGRLSLPLDEIIRQLPPDVFGAAMARGPVHVPGIESFPAPFTPMQRKEPAFAATPVVEPVSAPSPSIAAPKRPEPVSSPVAPAPTRSPVAEVATPPVHESAVAEPATPVMESAVTQKLVPPPPVTPTIDISIVEPSVLVERTRPPQPVMPSQGAADSGTTAESSASSVPVLEPPAPLHGADDPRRELTAFPAPSFTAATEPLEREAATLEPAVPPTVSGVIPASEATLLEPPTPFVPEPPAPFPTVSEMVPAEAPREATVLEPPSFPEMLSKEPAVFEPPAPFPTVREIAPAEAFSTEPTTLEPPTPFPTEPTTLEPPAPFPTVREIAPAEAFSKEPTTLAPPAPFPTEPTTLEPPAPFPTMREIAPAEAFSKEPTTLAPPARDIAPVETFSKDAAVLEPPAPLPTTRGVVSTEHPEREAVLEPPAPIEGRDLSVPAPVIIPPVSRVSAPEPTREPRAPMSTSPQPVPVAPLYEPRVFERPVPVEPTPPPPARREHLEKITALMGPLATVAPDEARVGDFTIISASTAGMATGTVTAAAGRLCPIIARGASHPIEQVTLRGAGGMLVLTPVGSGWSGGPTLAVGMRTGGALARLEMLSRRAATSKMDREPVRGAAPFARLDEAPTPLAIAAAAEDLTSFGPLAVRSYREVASGALVHCLVAPGVSAAALAPFAWELARVMAPSLPAEALGAFHSAVLRSEKTRVEIRKLPATAGPSQILVVAGSDTGRPGLTRLQVERTAARLSEA